MSKRSSKKIKEEMENAIAKKIEIAIAEITKQLDSATDPSVLSSLQDELAIYQGQLVTHPSVPIPLQDQLAILQVDLENLSTEKISQRPICRPIMSEENQRPICQFIPPKRMSEENQRPICQFIPPKRMSEKIYSTEKISQGSICRPIIKSEENHSTENISRKSCKSNKKQLEDAIEAISMQLDIAKDPSVLKSLHEQLAMYQGYLENRSPKKISPICGGKPIEKKKEDETSEVSSSIMLYTRGKMWRLAEQSDFGEGENINKWEDGTFVLVKFRENFTSVRLLLKRKKRFDSLELRMGYSARTRGYTESVVIGTNENTFTKGILEHFGGRGIGPELEDRSVGEKFENDHPTSYTIVKKKNTTLKTHGKANVTIQKIGGGYRIFSLHEAIPVTFRLRLEFINGVILVSSPEWFQRVERPEFPKFLGVLYLDAKAKLKREEIAKQMRKKKD